MITQQIDCRTFRRDQNIKWLASHFLENNFEMRERLITLVQHMKVCLQQLANSKF